jgi:hypothetical protein
MTHLDTYSMKKMKNQFGQNKNVLQLDLYAMSFGTLRIA